MRSSGLILERVLSSTVFPLCLVTFLNVPRRDWMESPLMVLSRVVAWIVLMDLFMSRSRTRMALVRI